MERIRSLAELPEGFGPSVVTIGNFDGVHRGHMKVLGTVVAQARSRGLQSVAVTFDPHPATVHRPEVPHHPIMGWEDSETLMRELGLDLLVLLPYSLDFSQLSPEEFVRSAFVDALGAKVVVIGADVRFGKDNSGDLTTMRELGLAYGFETIVVEDLAAGELSESPGEVGEPRRRCSSTWIRQLLAAGEVEQAALILGRWHRMRGEVVYGAARGRELGFPTANLSPESDGLVPADGVYAGWLHDESGQRWPAAISVGSNPTFEGVARQVEAHVMGRPQERIEDFDLYGQRILVEFVARLRPMVAYRGEQALIEQMTQDVEEAQRALTTAQAPAC